MNEILCRTFYGNEALKERFYNLVRNNTLPHSLILNGIPGIGKMSFALLACRMLAAGVHSFEALDFESTIQRQFTQGALYSHCTLDVPEDKRTITLEDIAPAQRFLQTKVGDTSWKTLVINRAHHLNHFAQNALLKAIEEPSPRTLIILVTEQLDNILPTIRSRSQTLTFNPLSDESLKAFLGASGRTHTSEEQAFYSAFAHNAPGAISWLREHDVLALYKTLLNQWTGFLKSGDVAVFNTVLELDALMKRQIIKLIAHAVMQYSVWHGNQEVPSLPEEAAFFAAIKVYVPIEDVPTFWAYYADHYATYQRQEIDEDSLITRTLINFKNEKAND